MVSQDFVESQLFLERLKHGRGFVSGIFVDGSD